MGTVARILSLLSRPFRWLTGGALALSAADPSAAVQARASLLAAESGAAEQARAALSAFSEPQSRSGITWTPANLRAAERSADSGDLRLLGELCDWLMGDDRVAAVVGTRCRSLFGCEMSFERGRGLKARAAVRAVEAEEDWWTLLPEAEQVQILAWGLIAGAALIHEEHGELVGGRMVPTFRVWSIQHARYDFRARQWFARVADASGGTREVAATPENGFHIFLPYGQSYPWRRGLWRGLARLVLLKSFAIQDFAGMSEIHGRPTWKVTRTEAPAASLARKDLADELATLARGGVVVMPAGYELDLVEATAKTWEMFVAQIKVANDAIAIAMLGGNLVTDAGDGAATGATAQTLVRLDLRRADAAVFSTWAHDVPLARWAVWNFGAEGAAPWPVYDVEPPADVAAQATALRGLGEAITALDAALAPHGLEADAAELCETYGVPVRSKAPALPAFGSQPEGAAVVSLSAWRGVGKRRRAAA